MKADWKAFLHIVRFEADEPFASNALLDSCVASGILSFPRRTAQLCVLCVDHPVGNSFARMLRGGGLDSCNIRVSADQLEGIISLAAV